MEEKLTALLFNKMDEDMLSGSPACILSRKDAKEIASFLFKNGVIVTPLKIGDPVYTIVDDCDFPGDCGTKQKCKGCQYRNCYIEKKSFLLSMLTDVGELQKGYFVSYEEAQKKLNIETPSV